MSLRPRLSWSLRGLVIRCRCTARINLLLKVEFGPRENVVATSSERRNMNATRMKP